MADDVHKDFHGAVNMTSGQLSDWLETDESRSVGQKSGGNASGDGESVGHEMGRRIIDLLGTKKADLTDDDEQAMHKVVGYVHRHSKQGPSKHEVETSKWRYSLMNWGHDPLKE